MDVYVMIRSSKKTGKVDTVMTGVTSGMMKLWALSNTTKTKQCMIINRSTGDVVFETIGTGDFPKVNDAQRMKKDKLYSCTDVGISYEMLQEIGQDDRF